MMSQFSGLAVCAYICKEKCHSLTFFLGCWGFDVIDLISLWSSFLRIVRVVLISSPHLLIYPPTPPDPL